MANSSVSSSGQAIIETLLSLPVLTMLLMAVFLLGVLFYVGQRSSGAVRAPLSQRMAMANVPGAISGGDLAGQMNTAGNGNLTLNTGPLVDSVTVNTAADHVIAYMVAQKTAVLNPLVMPDVTFSMVQGIDASLLESNVGAPTTGKIATITPLATANPIDYGFDPTTALWQVAAVEITATCSPTGSIDLPTLNGFLGSTYTLTALPMPITAAPIGLPVYGTTYTSTATLNALGALDNSACDNPASVAQWDADCLAEGAVSTCRATKQQACRIAYANQYVGVAVNNMSANGQCSTPGNGSDVTFKPAASYTYAQL
jgi:TadE-like protein